MVDIGAASEVSPTFHANGVFRAKISSTDYVYLAIQDLEYSFDETNQDEEWFSTGKPLYTRIGDKIGSCRFDMKKMVSLFETGTGPTDGWLLSKWLADIVDNKPPEINFIETLYAKDASSNKFARVSFTGRLRGTSLAYSGNQGAGNVRVHGDIISFTSAIRASS